MQIMEKLTTNIYSLRGEKIMLDRDLAALYETPTKSLNLAVKRNLQRFPADFMFRLNSNEWQDLRLHIETSNPPNKRGGDRYLPYAFTEQGVAMLSSVLNSEKAIAMNIAIMRAFIAIKKAVMAEQNFKAGLEQIKLTLSEHDEQLKQLFVAMENLLEEKSNQQSWEERERIGFK